jgi:uncharacterized protein (TIGR00369 family)
MNNLLPLRIPSDLFEANAKRIRAQIGAIGFRQLVGSQLDDLGPGSCTVSIVKRPDLLQHRGLFHGGVSAFLIDHAATIAAATVVKPGRAVITAEFKINLLAPATGERLVCRASVIRPGQSLIVVAANVFSIADGKEKHTATALASIAAIEESKLPAPTTEV